MERGLLFLDEQGVTYVYDAKGMVLGRMAAHIAKQLILAKREGRNENVVVINCERAVVSGKKEHVISNYKEKYQLNHPRKGPFFPRMPDKIFKRTVRGMLPYQKKTSGRMALKSLRVEIGCPHHLSNENLPDGYEWGDKSGFSKPLPSRHISLGDISAAIGAPAHRWNGGGN